MDDAEEEMNYLESLQKQNSDLKNLIAQMRSEMESLAPEVSKPAQSKSIDRSEDCIFFKNKRQNDKIVHMNLHEN